MDVEQRIAELADQRHAAWVVLAMARMHPLDRLVSEVGERVAVDLLTENTGCEAWRMASVSGAAWNAAHRT
jgi:hypothetical protein